MFHPLVEQPLSARGIEVPVKRILALAIVGALGWFAYHEVDLGEPDVPAGPSVGYPVVDAGGGVSSVGSGAKDAFGP